MLKLQSSAIRPDGTIPGEHTSRGKNQSPPLSWTGAPPETKTYALIMHDPDARSGDVAHWVVFNMPATRTELPADNPPHTGDVSDGTMQGRNDFDRVGYGGPNPPPGEPHRYHFELFALDTALELEAGAKRAQVEQAMRGHVLAHAKLMGRYRNRGKT